MENKASIIDSYEFVIRFNDFKINGYEEHVGTKVDAISFHCNDFTLNHTKYLLPTFEKYVDKTILFTISNYHSSNSKNEIIKTYSNTQLFNMVIPYDVTNSSRLSSGTALALNLSIFFQKDVHLIGFDGYKTAHYYDDSFDVMEDAKKANIIGPAHNSDCEDKILKNIKNIKFL